MTRTRWISPLPPETPVSERREYGRAARERLPRSALRDWQPPVDRPSASSLLRTQEESRIPGLVPLRRARMGASALAFYRGSAIVMAGDLGRSASTGLETMLCGDAHLSNFGVFGSAEHNVVFDLNDFDETAPGPFEWDLLRLATSFLLTAADQGMPPEVGVNAATASAIAYQRQIDKAAESPLLGNWYRMFTPDQILDLAREVGGERFADKATSRVDKSISKARARDAWSAVRKLTSVGEDGRRRFLDQPPLLVPIDQQSFNIDLGTMMDQFLSTLDMDRAELLAKYQILDLAHKVVGVGSVGLPAVVALLQGPDPEDLLVMQFKAAQASVLEEWTKPAPFEQHGERVVVGQRAMQASGDPFLGWVRGQARGIDFYGRQLRDFKWSIDLMGIGTRRLQGYAVLCGSALGMAHARLGDPHALSAYMGKGAKFAQSVAGFAQAYARVATADYQEFVAEGIPEPPENDKLGDFRLPTR